MAPQTQVTIDLETRNLIRRRIESIFTKESRAAKTNSVKEESGLTSRGDKKVDSVDSSQLSAPTRTTRVKEDLGLSCAPDSEEVDLYNLLSTSSFKEMYLFQKTKQGSVICLRKTQEQTSASKTELNNNGADEDYQVFPNSFPKWGIEECKCEDSAGSMISGIKNFFLIHLIYIFFLTMYYILFSYCLYEINGNLVI